MWRIVLKSWFVALAFLLAACAQAQDSSPAIQSLTNKGISIRGSLPAPTGFKGYVGDYQGQAMPVYLLPDGKHVVIGTLFDQRGNDLTAEPMQTATMPALDATTWAELGKATFVAEGATEPKRIVYVFTDTECPYCHKLWQATQPLLAGGDVQVRHIIVAVISPRSPNRAAAILEATDPKAVLHQHERTFGNSSVQPVATLSKPVTAKLAANNALMDKLGVHATPATVYKDASGKLHLALGMLPEDKLKNIFGR